MDCQAYVQQRSKLEISLCYETDVHILLVEAFGLFVSVPQKLSSLQQHNLLKAPENNPTDCFCQIVDRKVNYRPPDVN